MMMDDRQAVTEIMSWRRAVHQSISNEVKRGVECKRRNGYMIQRY